MSITVLADVIAPNSLWSAGVRGKQIRRNLRAQIQSGEMQINVGWSRTLRQYTIGSVPLTVEQWQTLEGLHEVTAGGAYGFLLLDPKDSSVTDATGKATLVSAPAHTYQLVQRKTAAGSTRTHDRIITRPRAAGFVLSVSGAPTGSFTLDPATGIVMIPAGPAAASVTWSGVFYVPVHFEDDEIDWELVRAGVADSRLMAGPSVLLTEVRE
jgi:uncharacterized protein (TIGR02217 family)